MNQARRYCNSRFGTTFCSMVEDLGKNLSEKQLSNSVEHHADKILTKHIENVVKNGTKEDHSKIKDLITPVFFDVATKPNTAEVGTAARDRAILSKASSIYNETKSQDIVNDYLTKQQMGDKYVIDYDLSTGDGLVAINTKTNKATLAFRGSRLDLQDAAENLEHFVTTQNPQNSLYNKRIRKFYDKVVEQYDVEHLSGYSKGGHGAITLGDDVNIETTTFNPFVSIGNLQTTKNNKHKMYFTTEDPVSLFAHPFRAKNTNTELNILDPLLEYDTFEPKSPHELENFIKSDPRRSSHLAHLHDQRFKTIQRHGELMEVKVGAEYNGRGGAFFDTIAKNYPSDITTSITKNLGDLRTFRNPKNDEASGRVLRNGLQQTIWRELGGQFTDAERIQLANQPENTNTFATTTEERLNFAKLHPHEQQTMLQALQDHSFKIDEEIYNHNVRSKPLRQIISKAINEAKGYKEVALEEGERVTTAREDLNIKAGKMGETVKTTANRAGVSVRGVATGVAAVLGNNVMDDIIDDLPEEIKKVLPREEVKAATMGGVAGAVTTGASLPMALGAVAALKASEIAKHLVDFVIHKAGENNFTDFQKEQAHIVTEGAVGGATMGAVSRAPIVNRFFGTAAKGIASIALGATGLALEAIPEPITDGLGGVAFAEALNIGSKMLPEETQTELENAPESQADLNPQQQQTYTNFVMSQQF